MSEIACDSKRMRFFEKTKRCLKWTAAAAHFPLAYAWIPISCCFVAPTIRYSCPELAQNMEEGTPMDRVVGNTCIGGFMGLITVATCCWGCGNCCTQDPSDVFEENC